MKDEKDPKASEKNIHQHFSRFRPQPKDCFKTFKAKPDTQTQTAFRMMSCFYFSNTNLIPQRIRRGKTETQKVLLFTQFN